VAPDPAAWRTLEDLLAEHPARWLIWEAAPQAETARRLETLGLRSVVYAPGGSRPADGDWLDLMRANAARLGELAEG
jgi:zinc transport system substrate-binding protein